MPTPNHRTHTTRLLKAVVTIALTCGLIVVPTGRATSAAATVKIRVSPATAYAPATLLVQVLVEHHEDNRAVRVVADSGSYFSSSEVQLDGVDAPGARSVTFHNLPPGDYEVRGELLGISGKVRGMATATALVVGR